MELERAKGIARWLVDALRPGCERIEVAGSVRRGKREVKDIEVVAAPVLARDVFGEPTIHTDCEVDFILRRLVRDGRLGTAGRLRMGRLNGRRQKQLLYTDGGDVVAVDLFLVVPPADWGLILALRTGPGALSRRMVTIRERGGLLPMLYKVEDGQVWKTGIARQKVLMAEEEDFLQLVGLGGMQPRERDAFCERRGWR